MATPMTLDNRGNYQPWHQPDYGRDAAGKRVAIPAGHRLLRRGSLLKAGDVPFDVYAGWRSPIQAQSFCILNSFHAQSQGRWTTWARPNP